MGESTTGGRSVEVQDKGVNVDAQLWSHTLAVPRSVRGHYVSEGRANVAEPCCVKDSGGRLRRPGRYRVVCW